MPVHYVEQLLARPITKGVFCGGVGGRRRGLAGMDKEGWAEPPASFRAAKRLLAEVHQVIGHQRTLYCGCRYERNSTRSLSLPPFCPCYRQIGWQVQSNWTVLSIQYQDGENLTHKGCMAYDLRSAPFRRETACLTQGADRSQVAQMECHRLLAVEGPLHVSGS